MRKLVSLASIAAVIAACSSESPPSGTSTSSGGASSSSGNACIGFGCTNGGVNPPAAVCATQSIDGTIKPLHMVISVDVSGSMCETGSGKNCDDPNSKWQQAKAGLDAFARDASSKGVSVSLIPWSGNACGDFSVPKLPVTDLPSSAVKATLDNISPTSATPTSSALEGALTHANALKATADGKKIIIVFVTDGLPTACPGDGTEETQAAFDAALEKAEKIRAAKVPLYVLGVGNQLSKLDELASAGGSPDANGAIPNAIAIPLSDPGRVNTLILSELKKIRGGDIPCESSIPLPPEKRGIDYSQARVSLKGGANDEALPYSQNCENKKGWKYDPRPTSTTGATSIKLCAEACTLLRQNGQSSIRAEFGCTNPGQQN
jgi:hypothetical protein